MGVQPGLTHGTDGGAPAPRGARALTRRALDRLPSSRTARVFVLVAFVDAFGRGFFLAGSTLFYTQVIGLSAAQVGAGLSIAGLLGVACAVPIGRAADRFGDGPTLTALQLWRGASFLVYPFVDDFRMFLVVACLIGAVEQAVGPIIQSVAGSTTEQGSPVQAMAFIAVARNSAYALAAVLATVVITVASSVAAYVGFVVANALAFLATAALLTRLRLPRPGDGGASDDRRDRRETGLGDRLLPFRDPRFLLLSLANGVLYLHVPILSVAFPLWIVTRTDAPRGFIGVALVMNTVMAVALQVRFSRGGEDVARAGRKQRAAGAALAAFCVLTAAIASVGPALAGALTLLAAVPLTLGELWQSAGGWGISYRFAPAEQRTYYLSIYQLGATGVAVAGPLVLSTAVVDHGYPGWFGLGAVFALTGLAVPYLLGRRAAAAPPAR
ncbi:MFS transporter [Kitasatospora sp. NPDC048545]|uniref:MFS transporter n=1 Tax=Kitasatospora sp. NPDC048545 TaxID=3157208 RepID=UPI0034085E3C